MERIPTMTKQLNDEETDAIFKLIDRLEEDEDVANVFTTMDMSEWKMKSEKWKVVLSWNRLTHKKGYRWKKKND